MHTPLGRGRDVTDVNEVRRRLLKAGVYVAPAILGTVMLTQNAYASGPGGGQGNQNGQGNKNGKGN